MICLFTNRSLSISIVKIDIPYSLDIMSASFISPPLPPSVLHEFAVKVYLSPI